MTGFNAVLDPSLFFVESNGINGGILAIACAVLLIFGIVVSSRKTRMKAKAVANRTGSLTSSSSPNSMFEISVPPQRSPSPSSEEDSDDNDPFTRSGRPRMFGRACMVAPCRNCSHSRCLCDGDSPTSLQKGKRTSLDDFCTIAE